MMTNSTINADVWNIALKALPSPHVLQSWTWGAFKERYNWVPERRLWTDSVRPIAAAQILEQCRGRYRLGYISKGPVVNWDNLTQVEAVLSDLETWARQRKMLLLKIDPDVRSDTQEGKAVTALLKRRGWRLSSEQIQFRNTMVLDVSRDLDTIMEQMKSKWRYNIRLAVRKGVTVRQVDVADFPMLYDMYAETANRDGFIIREKEYYLDAWRTFVKAGLAVPLVAEVEHEHVAMLILFYYGSQAWYMYGASRNLHRDRMPNYLLQWEAIRCAQSLGCTTYDLWGAPDKLDETDPLWGVYRFKVGFGSEFVPHIGAYDYAPNGFLYRLYALLRAGWIAMAQRRYWSKQDKTPEAL